MSQSIEEIFEVYNTWTNHKLRKAVIELYKIKHNIPDGVGVNVVEVMEWFKNEY